MNKIYTYSAALAVAGLIAVATPSLSEAQTETPRPERTPIQTRLQNAENNRDIRNEQLNVRNEQLKRTATIRAEVKSRISSSTSPGWINIKRLPPELMKRIASSTLQEDRKDRMEDRKEDRKDRREDRKEARLDQFAQMHKNLLDQNEQAISKLNDLQDKISDRIESAEERGRTMTEARTLLAAADAKISAAEQALAKLAAYVPPALASSSQADVTASMNITLDGPRVIGKEAIEATNQARQSLQEVVRAIAASMGLKTGQDSANPRQATTTTR